jgi:acyl-ACP thioesterase
VASLSALLRYMQDAACFAMEEDGPSYDDLFDRGYSFVITRLRVSVYAPIRAHDELTAETWACESRGLQFNRCYRLLRNGELVAEAVSVWAVIGVNDRRPHRVSELDLHYREDAMLELDLPARFRVPENVEMCLVGERTVEYADVDRNGHMNNTHYPDILCSYLPDRMKGQRVISMGISFVSEAPIGETLKIYTGQSDGIWYIRTVRENGSTNAEAEIMTEAV